MFKDSFAYSTWRKEWTAKNIDTIRKQTLARVKQFYRTHERPRLDKAENVRRIIVLRRSDIHFPILELPVYGTYNHDFDTIMEEIPALKYALTERDKPPKYLVDCQKLAREARLCSKCGCRDKSLTEIETRTVPIPRIVLRVPYELKVGSAIKRMKDVDRKGCTHYLFRSLKLAQKLAYATRPVCNCDFRLKNHVHFDSFEQSIALCGKCFKF